LPIANRTDAMQCLLDTSPIIGAELRDTRAHVPDVFVRHRRFGEITKIVRKSSLGRTPEIQDDFDDVFEIVESHERLSDGEWEDVEEL
jgi:hypothetical protein